MSISSSILVNLLKFLPEGFTAGFTESFIKNSAAVLANLVVTGIKFLKEKEEKLVNNYAPFLKSSINAFLLEFCSKISSGMQKMNCTGECNLTEEDIAHIETSNSSIVSTISSTINSI